jgi:hypothetical protein
MIVLRRLVLGVVVFAVLLSAAAARAQVLKQVPADALVVIKLNNAEAVSKKLGELAARLGLPNFDPAFGDPISALKQKFNIKEGFDAKGEAAIAIYHNDIGREPQVVALIPVTDFKAFMGNLANVKQDGDLTTFTLPDDLEPIYAANWGGYAAISPTKEMLAKKPAGIEVSAVAMKELDGNDVTVYANAKLIAAKVLPGLQAARPMILGGMDGAFQNNPAIDAKWVPVIKALVNQVLNIAEGTLRDGRSATLGMKVSKDGVNLRLVADFEPASYAGKLMQSIKNTNASLVTGLPPRKYFAFGGAVSDPKVSAQVIGDLFDPIVQELAKVDGGKKFADSFEAMKAGMLTIQSVSAGYAQPTGILGQQQGAMQLVEVINGDAKKIAAANEKYLDATRDMMEMMPKAPGMDFKFDVKKGAKKVEGATFDQFSIQANIDRNTPQGAQIGQMMDMMYGPGGILKAHVGALDDKTFLLVMGGDEELLTSAVKSAKSKDTSLGEMPHIKAVTAALPPNRVGEFYICVDNFATTVLDVVATMGMPMRLKLPPNMPPIGISYGTEESALRFDMHISGELIEKSVAAGMQAAIMMQGGGGPPKRGGL